MRGKGEGSIFKDGRGYWTMTVELPVHDYKDDGTPVRRRKVIRSRTKKDLLDKLADTRGELRKRGDLPTAGISVQDWFTYWVERVAINEVRPKTHAGYESLVRLHIVPGLGPATKLNKVNAVRIRDVHDHITRDGGSSTYALLAHRIMARSFKIAVREGHLGINPAEMVDAPRKQVKEMPAFTADEAVKLLEHAATDPVLGARWATALLTGARRGEVLGLELDRLGDDLDLSWQLQRIAWSHGCGGRCGNKRGAECPDRHLSAPKDFEYRQIKGGLYWTRPKSKAGWRVVPLVDPLRSILERHIAQSGPNEHGLVFTNNGEPIDPDQDTRTWKGVLASSGIDRQVGLHGLRHTAVDLLYMAGVPEDLIQEIVGHSSRGVTRGYKTKQNQDRLRAAMTQMSALLTPASAGTPAEDARSLPAP